jgi:translocation and assembly module TamB
MKWLLGLVALALAAALTAAAWLVGTESGLRWALRHAPQDLTVEGAGGRLAGTVSAQRLAYRGVAARGVEVSISLGALLTGTLVVDRLHVQDLLVALGPREDRSREGLPLRVRITNATVDKLNVEGYELHNLRLEYSGGIEGHRLDAGFSLSGAAARVRLLPEGRVSIQVDKLDVARIKEGFPTTSLSLKVEGKTDLKSTLEGRLEVLNALAGPIDQERVPVERLTSAFSADFNRLQLRDFTAALPGQGRVSGSGELERQRASFEVRVAQLNLRGLRSNLRETRLAGALKLAVEPNRQRVQGSLEQADLSLAGEVERSGDLVEVKALRARAAGGEATGSGRVRLGEPPRFEAVVRFSGFDPARFGDWPEGSLNGTASVTGSLGTPRRLEGHWTITNSTLYGEAFATSGEGRLTGERVAGLDARLRLGANRATARGAFGAKGDELAWTLQIPDLAALERFGAGRLGGALRARGTATGTLAEPRIAGSASATRVVFPNGYLLNQAELDGAGTLEQHRADIRLNNEELDLAAKVSGGWRDGLWRGELVSFANAGAYPVVVDKPTPLEVGRAHVALGRFDARVAGGRASVQSLRWEEGRLTTSGAFADFPAGFLVALFQLQDRWRSARLLLDGDWSLVSTPKLNGRLSLRRKSGDLVYQGRPAMELNLKNLTLDARFADGAISAALDAATAMGTVRLEAEAGGFSPDSPLAFTAEIESADLRALSEPYWTQLRLTGRVSATLRGSGTVAGPILYGSISSDTLGLDAPPYGIYLREGRLRADIEHDVIRVSEFVILGGEGSFGASGTLPLRFASGGAKLAWNMQNFRLLNRPDRRLVASGEGVATFDGKRFGLTGELRADSGRFDFSAERLPELADDIVVAGVQKREPRTKQARALPVDLDMRVDLGEDLRLRGWGFVGKLAGRVQVVTSSSGELLALGKVTAVNGTFRAYGQTLEVDPGMLVFDGPLDDPALQISAWRKRLAVEAGVLVSGSLKAPRVELTSNPPVSEGEKLSWLVLGRAPTDASGADLAVLQAAAGAFLTKGDALPINQRIARAFGFDEISVRGTGELANQVVAVGKRLTERIYVSFEQGIGVAAETLVKVDLALTERWSARAQSGTSSAGTPTNGVGLFYRFSWD